MSDRKKTSEDEREIERLNKELKLANEAIRAVAAECKRQRRKAHRYYTYWMRMCHEPEDGDAVEKAIMKKATA